MKILIILIAGFLAHFSIAQEASPAVDSEISEEEKVLNFCIGADLLFNYRQMNICLARADAEHRQKGTDQPFSLKNDGAQCFKKSAEWVANAHRNCEEKIAAKKVSAEEKK